MHTEGLRNRSSTSQSWKEHLQVYNSIHYFTGEETSESAGSGQGLYNEPKATEPGNANVPRATEPVSRAGPGPFPPLQAASLFKTIFLIFKDGKES